MPETTNAESSSICASNVFAGTVSLIRIHQTERIHPITHKTALPGPNKGYSKTVVFSKALFAGKPPRTIRTRSEDPCSKRICFVFLASFIFLSRNYPVFTDYPDFCYQNSIRVMLSLLYLKPVKPPLMAIYLFDQIRLPHLLDGITCIIAAESGSSPSKNLFARKEHCNSKSPLKFT